MYKKLNTFCFSVNNILKYQKNKKIETNKYLIIKHLKINQRKTEYSTCFPYGFFGKLKT